MQINTFKCLNQNLIIVFDTVNLIESVRRKFFQLNQFTVIFLHTCLLLLFHTYCWYCQLLFVTVWYKYFYFAAIFI